MSEESGFLFLPDCEIVLLPQRQDQSTNSELFYDSWLPISTPLADARQEEETEDHCNTNVVETSCPHCCLTLACRDDSSSFSLVEPTPRFDGRIPSMKPCTELCTCQERWRQRTDSALLVGLALQCQELGHVQIRSMEVMLKRRPTSPVESSEEPSLSHSTDTLYRSRRNPRAALAITIYIPEVHIVQTNQKGSGMSSKRRFISRSSKPLPPFTQLLLSILRTDWTVLENSRRRHQILYRSSPDKFRTESFSFFPSTLSLDEVYKRIGGAADSVWGKLAATSQSLAPERTDAMTTCYHLPNDVWQYHISVFLKAKSLDALRCSCKHFHRILQEVVPGLKLRLYAHQVRSLSWMRLREVRCIDENDIVSSLPDFNLEQDVHSAATGGATVLLRSRDGDGNAVRISQYTGAEVKLLRSDPLSRTVARGGLLCDDPGLGKTITVLSLVLQTFGLSTERTNKDNDAQGNYDKEDSYEESIFREYWKEQSIPTFRAQSLNKLLSSFIRANLPDIGPFMYPVDPERDGIPDYLQVIAEPICLQTIRKRIDRHHYDPEFASFQTDVLLCFRNAMTYHPTESGIHKLSALLREKFLHAVAEFQAQQVKSAKRSFSKAASKPNSSVAALVEMNHRVNLHNALVQSSGTLLVVPSVLLEHWEDQIRLHVDVRFCTNKIPVTFEFTGTADNNMKLEEIVRTCSVEKTHMPFLFIDKSGVRKLPSPQFLSMFALVITTNRRFTNEWKNGSFEEELRQQETGRQVIYESNADGDTKSSFAQSDEACPLLKVHWLRMIVDEGHSMGRGSVNSAISFASWISAERRWAMTGTPTRQVISHSGLTDLSHLMDYLKHDFFSRRHDGESVWKNMISQGWGRGMLSSFFRLRGLLALLMVRHTKRDIAELPLPRYNSRAMSMGVEEIKTYNTLVCAIQSNLAITSMRGKTSGLQDSLVHRSQGKHARKALRNVRLVCAGGTQVIPTITNQYWTEFLRDFEMYNPDPSLIKKMELFLSRATTEQVSPCDCCGTLLTTLLVVPCGDLVCTECFDPKSNECVACNKKFDIDVFQKLQPGMDYQWLHNIEEEEKKRKSTTVSALVGNDDSERASGVVVLDNGRGILGRLDIFGMRRRTAKPGDGHECEYTARREDGTCELCWTEHDYCNLLTPSGRCQVCYRATQTCPEFETKPSFVVQKLVSLYREQQKRESRCDPVKPALENVISPSVERRPLKVIVFSQFRNVLNTVGDRLIRRCGTACIAEYWGSNRKKALRQFAKDKECFCMLLGKDGSEGLDLSFVTNIIFLEQVYDKSLEEQVIARAWRMGAKGAVEIETLVAKDSVEELMARLDFDLKRGLQSSEIRGIQSATEKGMASEFQSAKVHFLLKNLRLITSPETNPLMADSSVQKRVPSYLSPFSLQGKTTGVKRRRVRFEQ